MLEEIIHTKEGTSVILSFKKGSLERDILDAVTESLYKFYWGEFLEELVDKPFGRRIEKQGHTNYWLESARVDSTKSAETENRWTYVLKGNYSRRDPQSNWFNIRERLLGFVNLYQNPYNYSIQFSVRDINKFGKNFKPDKNTSRKHAQKYLEFVERSLRPGKEHVLYIIRLEIDEHDFHFVDTLSGSDARALLLKKVRRGISKNIDFPYVFLGKEGIHNQESKSGGVLAPNNVGNGQQAQWLYDFIENPPEHCIKSKLTRVVDNSVRTIVYPQQVDYEDVLSLLREKIGDKRTIKEIKLKV
jgi:hypothetical protein